MLTPLALPAQDSSAEYNEPYQRKALEVYRTNVSSRSSEGHGQAPPGARYLADEFRAAGFPEQDIHALPFTGADGGETAALYRAATRPAMSYDGAVVETPLGLLPLGMLHQMVRGPDLLAVVIIVQRLFARWAGRGKPERPAAASAITVALAYAAPSRYGMHRCRTKVCDHVAFRYAREEDVSDREGAINWLAKHARERSPVFLPSEIPDDVLQTLRRLDLVVNVAGGVLVVRSPGDEPARVVRALVWPIVETLARMYAPAVVERDSAVRLYLGRTDPGPEIRIRQTGQTRWREEITPGVVIRVERGHVGGSRTLPVGEARVPVDTPETVLLSLPLQFLRGGGLADVALWMKSLVLSRPALTDAYRRQPRPVVLKRMEHIARDVGNERVADLLAAVLSEEQSVRIGRDRTGIGRELVIPPLITNSGTSHQPWLDRLEVLVRQSREDVALVLAEFEPPPGPSGGLDALLEGAREAKAYDAYHSSSIEGYRLSLDEVSALLGGGRPGGPEIEDVRSKLAILGYGIAFDRLLRRIQDTEGNLPLTGNLALDLYVDLFSPSVEAGIVSAEDLRGWRRNPVFIRDTLFVPPSPEKVGAMIEVVCDGISAIDRSEGLLRAILIHLWLVWIHPFPDGNGRVARFLMNTALLAGSLPWLTIRVDQRDAYFAALHRAQLDHDHAAFARFVARSVTSPARNPSSY